jgi:hypothetical protein
LKGPMETQRPELALGVEVTGWVRAAADASAPNEAGAEAAARVTGCGRLSDIRTSWGSGSAFAAGGGAGAGVSIHPAQAR